MICMFHSRWVVFCLILLTTTLNAAEKPLKVFILAGQSNMQGHARISTFDSMADDPKTATLLKEMRGPDRKPNVCEKVWISSVGCLGDAYSDLREKTGKLTAGFGAPSEKIGPEFTFGITMEKLLGEPILIIKTSWGGRSLHTDFRPPSAGPFVLAKETQELWDKHPKGAHGIPKLEDRPKFDAEKAAATGVYYREMIAHVKKVLKDVKRVVPDYDEKQGYELAGFVWFQGFNDYVDGGVYPNQQKPGGYDLYADLLGHFIRDVRKDLKAPKLPFVIGVMGIDGLKGDKKAPMMHFRAAQRKAAALDEFKGNVFAVETAPFWDDDLEALVERKERVYDKLEQGFRKAKPKPTEPEKEAARKKALNEEFKPDELKRLNAGVSNGGYHYLGAAKILAPIGKAFAEALATSKKVQAQPGDKPVKVFILAGQSNMEGQGFIKADPKRNEGKGTLEYLTKDKSTADRFKHLLDKKGEWVTCDDVWIHYLDRKGKLTVGYGAKEDRIGPELGFGHVIGEATEEPVLLIKLAWGGKSLAKDFRPPSSGGEVGPFYKEIVDRTKAVLKDLKKEFPEFGDRSYEIAGFGWHQGWNDRVNQAFNDEYEKNMANFIRDIRKDLGVKNLPFVIAETGMTGPEEKHPRALSLMKAQAAVAEYEEFKGNVAFVGTKAFWREKELSPSNQGYHWNTNAETYYLIGEAMGKAMQTLCGHKPVAQDPLSGWKHSGTLTLLTTPEGANLPANAVVTDFPVLVRLHRDWFDFTQARVDGADVRFTTVEGQLLAHQIEEWDAKSGTASVWVRVPRITGNSRMLLRMHWGNSDAKDGSEGKSVFNESNGYLSVWHMGESVRDEVGTLTTKNFGTTSAKGIIGAGRHFDGKARVEGGDKITTYPIGDSPHTTEVWFRPEVTNSTLIGWGNDKPQGKVVMQFRGPPQIRMDCWFSGANVESTGLIPLKEWTHVAHVCQPGDSRLYVNGVLAGVSTGKGSPLKIASPAGLWIGNWRNQQHFRGDLDEVRVSKVARSADWMRLQYENQKPMQTLVGPLVNSGSEFSVRAEKLEVSEGGSVRITAQAGGAQKVSWSVLQGDREEILAVDRFSLDFAPGRVSGDSTMKLRFKAVLPNEVKTRDIDISVRETIPDPEFTLQVPAEWDGRKELVLEPQITNLASLKSASGATDVKIEWSAGPLAVIKEIVPGKLRLLRAQNSGPLTITATLSNGGRAVSRSATIAVKEPATDPWVHRVPDRDEKPEEGQFYARDDRNEGTLHYNGTLDKSADEVFLKVFCDDKPFATETAKPGSDMRYSLSAKLKPGLVKYRVEFGTRTNGKETVLHKVGGLLCGDAYLIEGQSNAEALDLPWETPRETSDWVRTYGGPLGRDDNGEAWLRERMQKAGGKRPNLWCPAVWKFKPPEHETFVGWWGMQLGLRLVESQKVPVCIINGALGGTRIDQHQRNPAKPADLSTIYGRWLWRLQQAKLTHGIRAVIWHQGENDQPADGPSGDYGWVNYHRYFVEMAAGWKRDMPNVKHYYAFQIWPDSCAMGGKNGAGDRLREKQRTLPDLFSNLSVMSTLGIRPPGGCHFPKDGYTEFARLMLPLIERDIYGKKPAASITPPNLRRVSFANAGRDSMILEFDQPVVWKDTLSSQFYLDGLKDLIAGGSVEGSILTLKLKAPSAAKSITYLKETKWSQDSLLVGANGIAALTFCEVPISR